MSQDLRQSTQIVVHIGPFVDVGDGFTPEVGITLSGADEAELLKAGATSTTDISGATWAAITGCDGWYALTLTTSLTDTVGPLDVIVQDDSVCLPVHARFNVMEEAAYDALYGNGGFASVISGSVASGATATNIPTNLSESTDDHYNGRTLTFTTGALKGQASDITDYHGGPKELVVTQLTEAPDQGDEFVIS